MNHYCHRLLLYVTAIFSLCIFLSPLRAKASYSNTMYVIDATDTTITIDWSRAAQDKIDEYLEEGYTSASFDYFKLSYAPTPCDTNYVRNDAPKTNINTKLRQYTIKNLKPGTEYFISISWRSTIKGPKSSGSGFHNFQLNSAYTTKTADKTAKLLGTTGSTATIEFGSLLDEIETNCLAEGNSPSSFDITVGYADQASGKDAALKKAKEIAGKKYYPLVSNQGIYNMRGLKPGHSYSFAAAVRFSYSQKDGSSYSYKYDYRYFTLSDIKTKATDDSATYPSVEPQTTIDRRKDSGVGSKYVAYTGSYNTNVSFTTTAGKDSITVDWSKQSDSSTVIKAGQGESKICLVCVEEKQYDPLKDREEYGPNNNHGPNVREAVTRIDSKSRVTVDPKTTSYTFTGLKPATRYIVMMKCSYKKTSVRCDLIYPYKSGILTEGAKTESETRTAVQKSIVDAYMYDGVVKREGTEAYVDWTGALAAYYGQSAFTNHFAQLAPSSYYGSAAKVGYAELPKTYSKEAVKESYNKALSMAGNNFYNAVVVNYPYTNTRIYGLKADAKYVFVVKFNSYWYEYGSSNSYSDTLYIDETGTNYKKAVATKALYDGHSVSDSGSGSSGSGSSGSGNGGGCGCGGNSGSGSSKNNGNSGSTVNKGGNGSGSNSGSGKTTAPTKKNNTGKKTGASSKKDKKWTLASSKKKDNRAWIYYNTDKVSAKAVKKKAQTVTFKIANSKGKIKVKDNSTGKNKNKTAIKIKGRTVTVKFKKGAPRGTYKFNVTVGSKGKIKKTSETIKIKVK